MANTITIIIPPSQKYLCINSSQTRKRARSQRVVGQRCRTSRHETMSPPSVLVCGNHPEMDLCCGLTMTARQSHTQKELLMVKEHQCYFISTWRMIWSTEDQSNGTRAQMRPLNNNNTTQSFLYWAAVTLDADLKHLLGNC